MRSQFIDDKYLKTKCEPVTQGEFVGDVIEKMRLALFDGMGVGLAANQIGSNKRIIMIHTTSFQATIINPEIIWRGGGETTSKEGCLSFPGKIAVMARSKSVKITGYNQAWQPVKFKLTGLEAIVAQHETDHLEGLTCIARAIKVYER